MTSTSMIVEFLKRKRIRKIVLSSGTRNIPFACAVEADQDFECYSVVDERNAVFFALGVSQQSGEVVVVACTSGTAVSNYLSGMTEAYYSNTPLIVVSFDRHPYSLGQLETQKIDHLGALNSASNKSVSLPIVKDDLDKRYCERLISEAFMAASEEGGGPVHINVPIDEDTNFFYSQSIDEANDVRFVDFCSFENIRFLDDAIERLRSFKRILIVAGQNTPSYADEINRSSSFFEKLSSPILADNLSNLKSKYIVMPEITAKALSVDSVKSLLPDLILTFGNNFQERIKDLFRHHAGAFEHWDINPKGEIRDVFRSQSLVIKAHPDKFFEYCSTILSDVSIASDSTYFRDWKRLEDSLALPELPFTSFYAIKEFARKIPSNSIVHTSILNATRLLQFFKMDDTIRTYGNVNSFGIDGCLPTFLGQASQTKELAFLLIGDLSFFYAMNALGIVNCADNVRILLMNNGGGAEFYISPKSAENRYIDRCIGGVHNIKAEGWARSLGYKYSGVHNKAELEEALDLFVEKNDSPMIIEVFTDLKKDGGTCLQVYRALEISAKKVLEDIES